MTCPFTQDRVSRGRLQDRSAVLCFADVVPVETEFEQNLLGVLPVFRGGSRARWRLVELHWRSDHYILDALVVDVGDQVAVGFALRVVERLARCGQWRPHAGLVGQCLPPVLQVVVGELGTDQGSRFGGVGDQIRRRHEALVGGQLRQSNPGTESGPELVRLQKYHLDPPVILGLIAVDQRVHRQARRRSRDAVDTEEGGDRYRRRDAPHRLGQQRRIHYGRLAGALAVEQRRADAAGQSDSCLQVAEGRALYGGVLGAERGEGG